MEIMVRGRYQGFGWQRPGPRPLLLRDLGMGHWLVDPSAARAIGNVVRGGHESKKTPGGHGFSPIYF